MAGHVDGDHPVRTAQPLGERRPVVERAREAVQEHHRVARAPLRYIDAKAVHSQGLRMHRTETTSLGSADEYRRRSYRNWQSAAAGWEREREAVQAALAPLTDWMLERLAAQPGQASSSSAWERARRAFWRPGSSIRRPRDPHRPLDCDARGGRAPGPGARALERGAAGPRHGGDRPAGGGRGRRALPARAHARARHGRRAGRDPPRPSARRTPDRDGMGRRRAKPMGAGAVGGDRADDRPAAGPPGGPGMFSLGDAGDQALLADAASARSRSSRSRSSGATTTSRATGARSPP